MSEAIISRGGVGGSSKPNYTYEFKTEIIDLNTEWKVPKARNQEFDVRIFGGGGGSGFYGNSYLWCTAAGGGGGIMNNAILNIDENDIVKITIGAGGKPGYCITNSIVLGSGVGNAGGTTIFGHYLSAIGGGGGDAGYLYSNGGDGGSGGGAAIVGNLNTRAKSGNGSQFGGGGCYMHDNGNTTDRYCNGGNGGDWGGGGGAYYDNPLAMFDTVPYMHPGFGGKYGGDGGMFAKSAEDGTNTMLTESNANLAGPGKGGGNTQGGGGYGGCGGNSGFQYGGNVGVCLAGTGGGGYGQMEEMELEVVEEDILKLVEVEMAAEEVEEDMEEEAISIRMVYKVEVVELLMIINLDGVEMVFA